MVAVTVRSVITRLTARSFRQESRILSCQVAAPTSQSSPGQRRQHSTCTMDLVTMDERKSSALIFSTLQYVAERDYVPRPIANTEHTHGSQESAMKTALREHPNPSIAAEELDLVQAAERRQLYDKVVFLMRHGENLAEVLLNPKADVLSDCQEDPESLTGKGIGQALTLSRRMAAFCNEDTQLNPELVLVAPTRKVLQTTFLAFPYETPLHSIRNVPWICHPQMLEDQGSMITPEVAKELYRQFWGIDFSLFAQEKEASPSPSMSQEEKLLQQADSLLEWLQSRPESVIVGTSGPENVFLVLG